MLDPLIPGRTPAPGIAKAIPLGRAPIGYIHGYIDPNTASGVRVR